MKSTKPKTRKSPASKKPTSIPEFIATTSDAKFPVNLRLAKYGNKVGKQQAAICLVERISDWRNSLPGSLELLRKQGNYSEPEIAGIEANAGARVSWCKLVEDAIMENDCEFFEAIAEVLKYRKTGSEKAHPIEFHTWKEFFRLLWAIERISEDGKGTIADWPTKQQISEAVEAKGYTVPRACHAL